MRQSFLNRLAGTILLLLLFTWAYSQEGSGIFVSDEPFTPQKTGNLFLAVDNLNFFKNNEYKSKYVVGYTLTGAWIRPKLLFYPDRKFRFELGGQFLAYNGRDEYKAYPWFAAVYQPKKNLSIRMGSLNDDRNHGLIEPVMDKEHYMAGQPEAGIQTKYRNNRISADLWIDWQRMIFKGDPFKERFVFGVVTETTLVDANNLKLTLPLTFNGLHQGGEIDTDPGLATTHIAVSEGIKLTKKIEGAFLKSWFAESYLLQSTYPKGETALPSENGTAVYFLTGITSGYGKVSAGYWQGNRFFTPLGMPLFQNTALNQSYAIDQNRLWTLSYLYNRKIFDQSRFGFVFDMYYDPFTQKLSNSAALCLMINFPVLFRKSNPLLQFPAKTHL
jgi:hypothetical protein